MIKPFNKSASLVERERLSFNNVPNRGDFSRRDTSRSGNTCRTVMPWMMGYSLVELEQGEKQRFNSVWGIVRCIVVTLRAYFALILLVCTSFRGRAPLIQFSRRCLENLRLSSCADRYYR